LNGELDVQKASEPTDIIWENRHWSNYLRNFRRIIVYTLITIVLSLSALIIYKCSSIGNELKNKYPVSETGCAKEIEVAS